MKPIISVVVPIYKAEKYLHRCIDSIISQTYANLEIILVDDGSPDSCPAICDQYAELDPRVIVVHKKNGGVSSARNAGLNIMNGAYVCFVDSDDYLPADAVMNLYETAVREDASYVVGMCGFAEGNKVKNNIKQLLKITIDEDPEALLSYIVEDGSYSPYAKLYDATLIQDNSLRFREDMRIAEDTVFLRTYLRYCNTICMIPKLVYKYNADNADSLSKKAYKEYCWLYGEKMRAVSELIEKLPLSQERKKEFLSERGLNGIRISINHYFEHWKEKNQLKAFIKDISVCLLPWIDEDYDRLLSNRCKWWRIHYREFRSNNFQRLYFKIMMERRMQEKRTELGRYIKSIIKS